MREILFRGKRLDNGGWVEGDGIHYPKSINYQGKCFLDGMLQKANDWLEVIPETVGQYTGLKDKNGNKIFEGDIVQSKYGDRLTVKYGVYEVDAFETFGFNLTTFSEDLTGARISKEHQIIGNIYE